MRTETATLFLVLCGCVACAPPSAPDAGQVFSDAGVPCVTLPPSFDFGEVDIGLRRVISTRLVNPANQAVRLTFSNVDAPFESSIDASALSELTLGPLATQNVQLSFVAPDGRLHLAEFTFTGGKGCAPQVVTLSGLGAGGIEAPPSLVFPAIESGTVITAQLRIFNTRREPNRVFLNINASEDGLFHFSAPEFVDIPRTSTVEVPITFTATGDGPRFATLRLGSDHRDHFDVVLQAMSGVPVIDLSRRRIEADPLGMLVSAERQLLVRNTGRGQLVLNRISVTSSPPGSATEVVPMVATGLVRPGVANFVFLRLSPRSPGHREWILHFESNDPMTPALDVELVAEVTDVPRCDAPLLTPVEVMASPPYPRDVSIPFENTTDGPCVAEAVAFTDFTSWTLDLGARDTFVVPARSTALRVVTVTEAGANSIAYRTYPLGVSVTLITAAP